MDLQGKTALVTGANRSLGQAFAEALLEAGAGKVYAGARDPSTVDDARLVPVQLDVTSSADIRRVVENCADVQILINNAGIMLATSVLAAHSEDVLRQEMEVNVFGTLALSKALAPVLARNGGGAIVNMLSTSSWYVFPFISTYSATKHAALAVTDGMRFQLRNQGTLVVAVYAGLIETAMGASQPGRPKTSPKQVAARTIDGLRAGAEHVVADESAATLWRASRQDLIRKHADMQALWDRRGCSRSASLSNDARRRSFYAKAEFDKILERVPPC
jgi:NAD(P)-dependent dehydrogenase (short-subunit alcohol dehydrogenase family)